MEAITCPHCQHADRQLKLGRNPSGSQRYVCVVVCQRKYTPQPTSQGYAAAIRCQAIRFYMEGVHRRRIARHLGVVHQTVSNWVAAYAAPRPGAPPAPAHDRQQPLAVVEPDERDTLEGTK